MEIEIERRVRERTEADYQYLKEEGRRFWERRMMGFEKEKEDIKEEVGNKAEKEFEEKNAERATKLYWQEIEVQRKENRLLYEYVEKEQLLERRMEDYKKECERKVKAIERELIQSTWKYNQHLMELAQKDFGGGGKISGERQRCP